MKIGDKVRFLSETGGGIVAGFQGNNIVLVEDEDGFQIPVRTNDVVVVGTDDYNIKIDSVGKKDTKKDIENEPADRPVTFRAKPEERKGGDVLSVYLAFVPIDSREITNTKFEAYIVNDSNYYINYSYTAAEGTSWHLRSTGEVEPNTKLFIEEFDRETLNTLERVCVQLIAYKRDKTFMSKPPVDAQIRIDTVKFYKLHTFKENDFFEQPALLYTVIENDKVVRPLVIDAKKLKQEMTRKISDDNKKPHVQPARKQQDKDTPIVIDLHASELLETTSGLSAADILNHQLDVFRKTMDEYKSKTGTKLIFIHGKGEGVLRHAIIHELNYRYKRCPYQDASFQEYGYGATQVTIK
jgi:hypothetical protein